MSLDFFKDIEDVLEVVGTPFDCCDWSLDAENETAPLDDAEYERRKTHLYALMSDQRQIDRSDCEEKRVLEKKLETTTRNYLDLQRQCNYVLSEWQKIKNERDALKAEIDQMQKEQAESVQQEQNARQAENAAIASQRKRTERAVHGQKRKDFEECCETPCLSPEQSEGAPRLSNRRQMPNLRETVGKKSVSSSPEHSRRTSQMNPKISI